MGWWSMPEATRAHAERLAALAKLDRLSTVGPVTLAAVRSFDTRDFVMQLRERGVTPHNAQNTSGRRSAIDRRTTRHPGYGASQRMGKRIEEAFGRIKTIAGQSRTKLRASPGALADGHCVSSAQTRRQNAVVRQLLAPTEAHKAR